MKKILFSLLISFALNVFYTGILIGVDYFKIYRIRKGYLIDIPFYFSTLLIETAYPQIKALGKPSPGSIVLVVFIVYLINTIVYALPIYLIWRFFTRKKTPQQIPSEEPPPPPMF